MTEGEMLRKAYQKRVKAAKAKHKKHLFYLRIEYWQQTQKGRKKTQEAQEAWERGELLDIQQIYQRRVQWLQRKPGYEQMPAPAANAYHDKAKGPQKSRLHR